jgi:hypothetical protein
VRPRFTGPPRARGLERNPGPLVSALGQDDGLVLLPVTPLTRARSRAACTPSPATDDPADADRQLELLRPPRDTLTPLTPHRPALRALAPRGAHRRRRVGDNVRLTPRLTSALHHDFPHGRQWFDDTDTTLVCAVRTPWPTLNAVPLARRATRARCFHAHPGRSADVMAQRLQALTRATPRPPAAGGIAPTARLVQALVNPRRVTWPAIADVDAAMAPRAQRHPHCPWLHSRPGAGAVWAPRRLAACGAPRDRDTAAGELPPSAGIAPVTARRGHTSWGHWRLQGPTCLRHTFGAWAADSLRHACWARASSQPQRHQGTSQPAAVRALACTCIRRLLRWWQTRTPADDSVSRTALARRGSPLLHTVVRPS